MTNFSMLHEDKVQQCADVKSFTEWPRQTGHSFTTAGNNRQQPRGVVDFIGCNAGEYGLNANGYYSGFKS
jgi:hypothetical protein